MYKPYMSQVPESVVHLDFFSGLNNLARIKEGELSECRNMSGDCYPLLAPRKKRKTIKRFERYVPNAFAYKGAFVFTAITNELQDVRKIELYVNDYEILIDGERPLSFVTHDTQGNLLSGEELIKANKKTIVGMGAYAVIFPDKFYVNLVDQSDKGYLEQISEFEPTSDVALKITPCTAEGDEYKDTAVSDTAPQNPENGTVWVDTSGKSTVYKIWDDATSQWQQVATTYLKLSYPGIGKGFNQWDGVEIEGLVGSEEVKALNAEGVIIYDCGDDYIVIAGLLTTAARIENNFKISRTVPDMDFYTQSGNRIWGCRYGIKNGKAVNEIYACKQGDFKNWNCFLGISTDSYRASVGTDDAFTGAVTYGGYPIFFKENCIHKVYGSMPSNYQILTTECMGVEKGMADSLTVVDNILYYKGATAFLAYDGSWPVSISDKLTRERYDSVIADGVGHKVYFACTSDEGEKRVLVYDGEKRLWHCEDEKNIQFFARDGHILYFIAMSDEHNYTIETVTGEYENVRIGTNDATMGEIDEEDFHWSAVSGEIGLSHYMKKHLRKVNIRAKLESGACADVLVSFDGDSFRKIGRMTRDKKNIDSFSFKFPPVRCESFRVKFEGTGNVQIISTTFFLCEGSDVP